MRLVHIKVINTLFKSVPVGPCCYVWFHRHAFYVGLLKAIDGQIACKVAIYPALRHHPSTFCFDQYQNWWVGLLSSKYSTTSEFHSFKFTCSIPSYRRDLYIVHQSKHNKTEICYTFEYYQITLESSFQHVDSIVLSPH